VTGRSEDELAAALRDGVPDALAEATRLLDVPHAYTAARAAEMLAVDGGAAGRARLVEAALRASPHPVAWYGLSVATDAVGGWPGTPGEQGEALRRLVQTDVHPDVGWWGIRVFAAAPLPMRAEIAARWIEADDDALAVEAAVLVRDLEPLPASHVDRLVRVAGAARPVALALALRAGRLDVAPAVAATALDGGPHAFEAFDALEAVADAVPAAIDALVPALNARWRVRPEHVRAAGVLAAAGRGAAHEVLRRHARRRRADLRGIALVELLRHGTEADVNAVVRAVLVDRDAAADHVVGEAWRSGHPAAHRLVVDALSGHPDPDVRRAAAESARHLPATVVRGALEQVIGNDGDASVRASAAAALRALTEVELGVQGAAAGAEAVEEAVDALNVDPLQRTHVDDVS